MPVPENGVDDHGIPADRVLASGGRRCCECCPILRVGVRQPRVDKATDDAAEHVVAAHEHRLIELSGQRPRDRRLAGSRRAGEHEDLAGTHLRTVSQRGLMESKSGASTGPRRFQGSGTGQEARVVYTEPVGRSWLSTSATLVTSNSAEHSMPTTLRTITPRFTRATVMWPL